MKDPSLRGSIIISFTSSYEKCEDLEIITDKKYKTHRPSYISWQSEVLDKNCTRRGMWVVKNEAFLVFERKTSRLRKHYELVEEKKNHHNQGCMADGCFYGAEIQRSTR